MIMAPDEILASIDSLLTASILVPYTDRLKDGKTGFNTATRNFLGGVNGQDIQAVVPGTKSYSLHM